jgi:integrase
MLNANRVLAPCSGHCQPKLHAALTGDGLAGRMTQAKNPFRYFDSSPEVIRLVVMMYVRYPLSLRNVEDLLFERGIDICHETVRLWWNRFGPMFAGEIRRKRVQHMRQFTHWRWHLPTMALFTGARLNELCGLRLADFDVRDGADFFHIQANEQRPLKTAGADRIVPIHSELVQLGLTKRVSRLRREGQDQLFPNLRPGSRGYLSDLPSKFFADLPTMSPARALRLSLGEGI